MTKIFEQNIVDLTKSNLESYSIGVNKHRAIPDIRDGLKPVHRRIIYSMYDISKAVNNSVKSAKIIGDVLGTFHPHGDTAAYNAMTPLANWHTTKVPLIIPQGQFGTIQGDGAAAQRYTEAKLSKYGIDCIIGELANEKNVVDWVPNFSDTTMEPEFLPAKTPNLLINGTFGIGYGMKPTIPCHNLVEVIDETIKLMKNPEHEVMLIPDHPMKVDIIDTDWKAIAKRGRGSYYARAIIDIEDGPRGTTYLIVRSTPHMVFMNKVVKQIEDLAKNNVLQITDMGQESDENELKYMIQLKKGVDPYWARDVLYNKTLLQTSYHVYFTALDKFETIPIMSYKAYLNFFIDFRKDTIFRHYTSKFQYTSTRLHQVEALIACLESGKIDEIVSMIRSSDLTNEELTEYLVTLLNVTDLQADYILNTNVRNLSIKNLQRYKESAVLYNSQIDECKMAILSEDYIEQILINELNDIKKKYGEPRKCKVISKDTLSSIPKGDFKIIVTENNNIKKVHAEASVGSFRDDRPKFIIEGCNTEAITIFNETGRVYRLPINDIPLSDPASNGTDIRKILKSCTSNIVNVYYEKDIIELNKNKIANYITVLCNDGSIKKMDLSDIIAVAKSGVVYIKLDKGIFVVDAKIISGDSSVVVYDKIKALRIPMSDVPHQRRMTKGMKSLSSSQAEGMSAIPVNTLDVLVITSSGYINRISSSALAMSTRNRAGSNIIKLGRGDSIYKILGIITNKEKLSITTNTGNVLDINVDTIPVHSSVSKGEKTIPLRKGETIIDYAFA